ncbi:hypothetical protein Tco_1262102 [Tanacetum coccineum]
MNHKLIMINNIQPPIMISCSPLVHTFTGQDMMVPSVALWDRFARFSGRFGSCRQIHRILCFLVLLHWWFLCGSIEVLGVLKSNVLFLSNGLVSPVGFFGGGNVCDLLVYIPEASTLGFSEAVNPQLILPLNSVFSLGILRS